MRFLRTHTARQPNVRPGFDPYKLPHERKVHPAVGDIERPKEELE